MKNTKPSIQNPDIPTSRFSFFSFPFKHFSILLKTHLVVLTPWFLTMALAGGWFLASKSMNDDPYAYSNGMEEDAIAATPEEAVSFESNVFTEDENSEGEWFTAEDNPGEEDPWGATEEDFAQDGQWETIEEVDTQEDPWAGEWNNSEEEEDPWGTTEEDFAQNSQWETIDESDTQENPWADQWNNEAEEADPWGATEEDFAQDDPWGSTDDGFSQDDEWSASNGGFTQYGDGQEGFASGEMQGFGDSDGGGFGFLASIFQSFGSILMITGAVIFLLLGIALETNLTGSSLILATPGAQTFKVRDIRLRMKEQFQSKLRTSFFFSLYLILIFGGVIGSLVAFYFLGTGGWDTLISQPFVVLLLPLAFFLFLLGVYLLFSYWIKMVESDTTKSAMRQASVLLTGKWSSAAGWTVLMILIFLLTLVAGVIATYFLLQQFGIDLMGVVMGMPIMNEMSNATLFGLGMLGATVLLSFLLLAILWVGLGLAMYYQYLVQTNGDASAFFDSRFNLFEENGEVHFSYQKGRMGIIRTILLLVYPAALSVLLLISQGQKTAFIPILGLVLYLGIRAIVKAKVSEKGFDQYQRIEITALTLPIVASFFVSLVLTIMSFLQQSESAMIWLLVFVASIIANFLVYRALRYSYFTVEATSEKLFYWRGPWKPLLFLFGFKTLKAKWIERIFYKKEPFVAHRDTEDLQDMLTKQFFADQEYEKMQEMTSENPSSLNIFRNALYVETGKKAYRLAYFQEDQYVESAVLALVRNLHIRPTYIEGEFIAKE